MSTISLLQVRTSVLKIKIVTQKTTEKNIQCITPKTNFKWNTKGMNVNNTSYGQPLTTKTSNEYPSLVENACASWILSPTSASKDVS